MLLTSAACLAPSAWWALTPTPAPTATPEATPSPSIEGSNPPAGSDDGRVIDAAPYDLTLWRSPPAPAHAATPPRPTAPPPLILELVAILESDAERLAAFYHPVEHAIIKLATGEERSGYSVARIDAREVELVSAHGVTVMRLRKDP